MRLQESCKVAKADDVGCHASKYKQSSEARGRVVRREETDGEDGGQDKV
jgi:hypothetical protein